MIEVELKRIADALTIIAGKLDAKVEKVEEIITKPPIVEASKEEAPPVAIPAPDVKEALAPVKEAPKPEAKEEPAPVKEEPKPEPAEPPVTKEELNAAFIYKFQKIGSRDPLDALIRKYLPKDTTHVGITGVDESDWRKLLEDVNAL